jgi:hypothetical protein
MQDMQGYIKEGVSKRRAASRTTAPELQANVESCNMKVAGVEAGKE